MYINQVFSGSNGILYTIVSLSVDKDTDLRLYSICRNATWWKRLVQTLKPISAA